MKPGETKEVTVQGTFPSSKCLTVTSDDTVDMESNLDTPNHTLNITFPGITLTGNNKQSVSATENISIADMSDVLFGTWSGHFDYQAELAEDTSDYAPFEVTSENRHLIGYTGKANEELVIPATFTGEDGTLYKVTSIGDSAFYGCNYLTLVSIPDSVTYIGNSAFENCHILTSVDIPDSITHIGNYAFRYCNNLEDVIIPDSVTSIGNGAFSACHALVSIAIPNSVTTIGDVTFRNCSNLNSITIPDSVTKIGDVAFGSCLQLTSITIPSSVTTIGENVFSDCPRLTTIYYSGPATGAPWGAQNKPTILPN